MFILYSMSICVSLGETKHQSDDQSLSISAAFDEVRGQVDARDHLRAPGLLGGGFFIIFFCRQ